MRNKARLFVVVEMAAVLNAQLTAMPTALDGAAAEEELNGWRWHITKELARGRIISKAD